MDLSNLLIGVIIGGATWSVVAGMMIFTDLRRRGEKVSFLLLRLMLPKYVARYRQITMAEQGRPGVLFYHFVGGFNVALVAAVINGVLLASSSQSPM
jgi:hypothetical protein